MNVAAVDERTVIAERNHSVSVAIPIERTVLVERSRHIGKNR